MIMLFKVLFRQEWELTNFKINKIYGLMMPPFDNGKENKDETERARGMY